MMKETKGVCFLFSETGTEGGWWAMQEDGFVTEDGHWKYVGLQYLEEGDDFTVYADDGRVLFNAIVHQDTTTGAIPRQVLRHGKLLNHQTWKQQVVGGMWVHWVQKNTDPDVWGELFTGNKRCLLKRAERIGKQSEESRRSAGGFAASELVVLGQVHQTQELALFASIGEEVVGDRQRWGTW